MSNEVVAASQLDAACECSKCGRYMSKAKKVHRGAKYCETCYARLFKRALCPGCGNFARLPKFRPHDVCRKCELLAPCVRCKRSGRPVGKLTAEGPACASCAPYFRESRRCERCSKPSTSLVRTSVDGHLLKCCSSCRSRLKTSCCSACRRPRVIVTVQGPALCKKCFANGAVPCPVCAILMPAGRGKACEPCAWDKSLSKRVRLATESTTNPRERTAVVDFSSWLKNRRGAQFASLNLNRFLPFLHELHTRWDHIPTYAELVEYASAEELRRVRLAVYWLEDAYQLVINSSAREEATERRRIAKLLTFVPEQPGSGALHGYHQQLLIHMKEGRTNLRSIRLALGAAVRLLHSADPSGQKLPNQDALLKLLRSRPGLMASLAGFVGYLNRFFSCRMNPRVDAEWVSKATRALRERTLLGLYNEGGQGEAFDRRWISAALSHFHQLRRVGLRTFQYQLDEVNGCPGFSVSYRDAEYWVPRILDNQQMKSSSGSLPTQG